jgi:hypothetical protein
VGSGASVEVVTKGVEAVWAASESWGWRGRRRVFEAARKRSCGGWSRGLCRASGRVVAEGVEVVREGCWEVLTEGVEVACETSAQDGGGARGVVPRGLSTTFRRVLSERVVGLWGLCGGWWGSSRSGPRGVFGDPFRSVLSVRIAVVGEDSVKGAGGARVVVRRGLRRPFSEGGERAC